MSEIKELPESWEVKKLGEVCKIQTGKFDANHAKANGRYRFYTCAYEYAFCDTNRFNGENLILPGNGANVGEVFYYNGEFDAYQRTYILNEIKVFPKFLYYHLLGNWRKKNQDKQFGSATNYIRMANFTDYDVFVPPFYSQQAIVSKIEELFSELDKGVEDLKTAQAQLKVYRQSVLKWAFEGKLTNVNVRDGKLLKGWKIVTFGEACEKIFDGTHFSPKNFPTGKYKYITAKNIKEKGIDLTKISYVSEKDHREIYSRSDVKKGDILYIKDGATTGVACVNNYDEEFSLLSSVGVFRVNPEKLLSKYVAYFLNSQITRNKMLSNIAGVAITRLTLVKLKNSELTLAPINEQYRIVQEIETRLSVADKMEESIKESLLKAEALRQSILKKAFGGELV